MVALKLEQASRKRAYLKMALYGGSGMGKTFTMLKMLTAMAKGKPIAIIDSEMRSSEKYQGSPQENGFQFYIVSLGNPDKPDDLTEFSVEKYVEALKIIQEAGIEWVGIDSGTHAYLSTLEDVEKTKVKYRGNSFAAWRDVTPRYNAFVRYIINSPLNIVCCFRAKDSYVLDSDEDGNSGRKTAPKKVGVEPITRNGFEYEFDIVGQMQDSNLIITKSRCSTIAGKVFKEPGNDVADIITNWLSGGVSEEDENKLGMIRRIVELQDSLVQAGEKVEQIDLNALSSEQLMELGMSYRKRLDALEEKEDSKSEE